jgi:hypothetical protein
MQIKRGFFALAVVTAAAGVASAFAFAPADPAARLPARELSTTVDAKPAASPASAAPAAAPAAPVFAIKKASIEVKQAPVPLLVKPRPTIERPAVNTDRPTVNGDRPTVNTDRPTVNGERPAASAEPMAPAAELPAKATGSPGDSAAKAAIEADGYKGVKVMHKGENGLWYAKAMRGRTEVVLTVDAAGRVTLE